MEIILYSNEKKTMSQTQNKSVISSRFKKCQNCQKQEKNSLENLCSNKLIKNLKIKWLRKKLGKLSKKWAELKKKMCNKQLTQFSTKTSLLLRTKRKRHSVRIFKENLRTWWSRTRRRKYTRRLELPRRRSHLIRSCLQACLMLRRRSQHSRLLSVNEPNKLL